MFPRLIFGAMLLAMTASVASAQLVWIAGRDLAANEASSATELLNPNAVVPAWSYGFRSSVATANLTLFSAAQHGNALGATGLEGYSGGAGPDVTVNVTTATISTNFGFGPNPGIGPLEMRLHPASNNDFAVVRWTAPIDGMFAVSAYWRDDDLHGGNGATGHIVLNGVSLFDTTWANGGSAALESPLMISVFAGDKLDFLVGAAGDWSYDSTAFNATIVAVPEPGSVILLGLGGVMVLGCSIAGWGRRRPRPALSRTEA
jgi:hypothetical protein